MGDFIAGSIMGAVMGYIIATLMQISAFDQEREEEEDGNAKT